MADQDKIRWFCITGIDCGSADSFAYYLGRPHISPGWFTLILNVRHWIGSGWVGLRNIWTDWIHPWSVHFQFRRLSLSLSLFLAGSLDRWQVNSQIRRGFLLRVTELVRDTYPYSKWPRFNPTIVALYREQSIEFICLVPSQDVIGLDSIPGTIDRLMVGLAA